MDNSEGEFIELKEPPSKRRYLWQIAAVVVGVAGLVYLTSRNETRRYVETPWPLGFAELIAAGCADTGSLDGTRELHLLDNQQSVLYVKDGAGAHHTVGTWSFDQTTKQYSIVIDNAPIAYSMIAPERTGICMLINGESSAADLQASWFALSPDVDPSEFQDRERDTPGL
jgi:hypothetical protein